MVRRRDRRDRVCRSARHRGKERVGSKCRPSQRMAAPGPPDLPLPPVRRVELVVVPRSVVSAARSDDVRDDVRIRRWVPPLAALDSTGISRRCLHSLGGRTARPLCPAVDHVPVACASRDGAVVLVAAHLSPTGPDSRLPACRGRADLAALAVRASRGLACPRGRLSRGRDARQARRAGVRRDSRRRRRGERVRGAPAQSVARARPARLVPSQSCRGGSGSPRTTSRLRTRS